MFSLHPQLQQDCQLLGRFRLSILLLSKDANFPWCILVPERESITEIHHLGIEDRQQLMAESCLLSEAMADLFTPDKMNIGVLGNKVPQLHMHHIARYKNDCAWPGPVWGAADAKAYDQETFLHRAKKINAALVGEEYAPTIGSSDE